MKGRNANVLRSSRGRHLPFFAWSSSYCSSLQRFSSLSSSSAVIRLCREIRSRWASPAWESDGELGLNGFMLLR